MTKLTFKAKNKKYQLNLKKEEDLLILLDKFLKKNKIDKSEIKDLKVSNFYQNSFLSYRIVSIIIKALELAKKSS